MTQTVDACDSTTGWTGSDALVTFSLVGHADYVANNLTNSLAIHFPALSKNKYATKTISVDVTGKEELSFHVWSRNKKNAGIMPNTLDYAYSIDFGDGTTYMVPTYNDLVPITLGISKTTLTRIRITCLHDDSDWLIISSIAATKDQVPLDVLIATKAALNTAILTAYPKMTTFSPIVPTSGKGILIGKVTGAAGDLKITLPNASLLERYCVIMIEGGGHTETHHIDSQDGQNFYFTTMYHGAALLYAYTAADCYMTWPAEYGLQEHEIILPSIAIWATDGEEVFRTSNIENEYDTVDSVYTEQRRYAPATFKHVITLDVTGRTSEIVMILGEVARKFVSRQVLWVNNKKYHLFPEGGISYVEAVEGYNELPKIAYRFSIELKEERLARETLVARTVTTVTYELDHN